MLQNADEIAKELQEEKGSKGRRKLYRSEEKAEIISEEVQRNIIALRNATLRGKVYLPNTNEVMARTEEYFEACRLTGTFPSMMGLSAKGFGVSRQAVSQFMHLHPEHPTSEYLILVKDIMADILVNASLNNQANVVQAIFQLKNHFGHEDNVKFEAIQTKDSLLAGAKTRKEIEERYKDSVISED